MGFGALSFAAGTEAFAWRVGFREVCAAQGADFSRETHPNRRCSLTTHDGEYSEQKANTVWKLGVDQFLGGFVIFTSGCGCFPGNLRALWMKDRDDHVGSLCDDS